MSAESRANSPPKSIFLIQSGSSTAKVKHLAKSMVPEPAGVGVGRVVMKGLASNRVRETLYRREGAVKSQRVARGRQSVIPRRFILMARPLRETPSRRAAWV